MRSLVDHKDSWHHTGLFLCLSRNEEVYIVEALDGSGRPDTGRLPIAAYSVKNHSGFTFVIDKKDLEEIPFF